MSSEALSCGSQAIRLKTGLLRLLTCSASVPATASLICLIVYYVTLAPTVTSEDSGELTAAAYFFGVPHPPGYPLWAISCGLFLEVFAVGPVAWRANLFSALCAALAIGVLCRCLLILGVRRSVALGSSLAVGFGAVYWSQSVVTEVYTLHALMFSLVLWSILKWHATGRRTWLIGASVFLGLGMCNHHTLGLAAVGLATWVILLEPRIALDTKLAGACILAFALALLPYGYLLVRARANPPINWGEPRTIAELVRHVNREQYKVRHEPDEPVVKQTLDEYARQLKVVAGYCVHEHTPYLMGVSALGLVYLVWRRRRLALLFGLVTVANVGLFLALHGIGAFRQDLWSSKVFFIAQYMVMAVPLAFGLHCLAACAVRLAQRMGRSWCARTAGITVAGAAALTGAVPLVANWRDDDYRNYWYAYDHALNMLESMLPDAMVIPSGDHNTFPLLYVTLVERMRPDLVVADKYGYLDPELYQEMPGYVGRRPHSLAERREIEEWLIRNAKRPVYYTTKVEPLVSNADLVAVGMLYHLLPHGKSLDYDRPWEHISYRNVRERRHAPRDYGADNILADYEFFRGLYEIRLGRTDEALRRFDAAARHGRDIKEVYNNIACALAERGHTHEAITYYRKAAALDPGYTMARWNLARLYKTQEDWQKAEEVFLELAEATPEDFRVFGELGFLALKRSAPMNLAVDRFNESLRLNPVQPQIIRELARYYGPGEEAAEPQTPGTTLPERCGQVSRDGVERHAN